MKQLIAPILERPDQFDWTLHGLGMLRTYLDPNTRLHIWSAGEAIARDSGLHNHPWDMQSWVIAGRMINTRFIEHRDGELMNTGLVRCGPAAPLNMTLEDVDQRRLLALPSETLLEGSCYSQRAAEFHVSEPDDGTVTLMRKEPHADVCQARIAWPANNEWISADAYPASVDEVERITQNALQRWFS